MYNSRKKGGVMRPETRQSVALSNQFSLYKQENAKNIENYGQNNSQAVEAGDPNEVQLVLLCLDYLRSLRRSRCASHNDLDIELGINQDYITVAIWALSNSFSRKRELSHGSIKEAYKCIENPLQYGNDPFFHPNAEHFASVDPLALQKRGFAIGNNIVIPHIEIMENELLYKSDPKKSGKKTIPKGDDFNSDFDFASTDESSLNPHRALWYKYNDEHYSNQHRFYKTMGLSSKAPLTLPQIAASGIAALNAKGRIEAEENFMGDTLFQDFVDAVKRNGFFKVSEKEVLEHPDAAVGMSDDEIIEISDKIHEERFRKVVSKFRTKLAVHYGEEVEEEEAVEEAEEDNILEEPVPVVKKDIRPKRESKPAAVEKEPMRKETKIFVPITQKKQVTHDDDDDDEKEHEPLNQEDDSTLVASSVYEDLASKVNENTLNLDDNFRPPSRISLGTTAGIDKTDLENAERLKGFGNIAMQKKKYEKAKYYYTKALEIIPAGPTSHVYFSNRAAALLSMRNFNEAVWDAERSIALKPDYAKAYARLGLAYFLLERYQDAVDSYTQAVKYDPSNETSVLYLEKSKKKLLMADPHPYNVEKRSNSDNRGEARGRAVSASRRGKDPLEERLNTGEDPPEIHLSPKTKISDLKMRVDLAAKKMMSSQRLVRATNENEELVKEPDPPVYHASSNDSGKISNEEQEADRLKGEGNKAMARKQYEEAVRYYSRALRLSPAGSNSHVYFSNRAAALCYLERYEEAELDAERSLALSPEYGKAHARLGLSRYFLKDYYGAVEAYESALRYDPDNAASKSYLAKARAKVTRRHSSSTAIQIE